MGCGYSESENDQNGSNTLYVGSGSAQGANRRPNGKVFFTITRSHDPESESGVWKTRGAGRYIRWS